MGGIERELNEYLFLEFGMEDSVPSGIERRRALEELGRHATGDPRAEVMEGLFLRSSRKYLGLFRIPNELEAVVGGLDTPTGRMTSVAFLF